MKESLREGSGFYRVVSWVYSLFCIGYAIFMAILLAKRSEMPDTFKKISIAFLILVTILLSYMAMGAKRNGAFKDDHNQ